MNRRYETAHQCTPYAANASAAMYNGGAFANTANHVNPIIRKTPVMNCMKPFIQTPHIAIVRFTSGESAGHPNSAWPPQMK